MNENAIGKEVERIVSGLPQESLGVLASWRETQTQAERGGATNAASPPR